MIEPKVYDSDKVLVSLGAMFLTGYAEDTKIEVEKNEDDTTPTTSIDGSVTYSENHDNTAKVKISLMSTSACLPRIYEIAKNRESFPLSIVDLNDDSENITCDYCRIIKRPNKVIKKQAETVEFEVFIPEWK